MSSEIKFELIGAPPHLTNPTGPLNIVWRDHYMEIDPLLGRVKVFLVKISLPGDEEVWRLGIGVDMTPIKDGTASPALGVLAGMMQGERVGNTDILVLTRRLSTVTKIHPDYLTWAPQRKSELQ